MGGRITVFNLNAFAPGNQIQYVIGSSGVAGSSGNANAGGAGAPTNDLYMNL
jgi:hypothetical protein